MDPLGPFGAFILAAVVGCSLSVAGYLAARKAGLGPVQGEIVKAYRERLDQVEAELTREKRLRAKLARKVSRLERTLIGVVEENGALRDRLNMPRRSVRLEELVRSGDEDDSELEDEDQADAE